MTAYKVVVDGSNVATEGRTMPSLSQLDEAVRGFIEEHPGADVLVIVDSSFPNRIDPKDLPIFESAYNAGEIITPPAGTIGRGDSFILKVADKLGATVFSNDSFQEFHGTYDWLFEKGRLVGGKPIPGLGWVFTPRTPVRGPKSREAVREAKRTQVRIGSPEAMKPMPVPKAPPAFLAPKGEPTAGDTRLESNDRDDRDDRDDRGRGRGRGKGRISGPDPAFVADRSVAERSGGKKRRRRGRRESGAVETNLEPINDAISFLSFVASHKVATEVEGLVDTYSSHGFYVMVDSARCYVQLSGISSPAPRSAKEVVRRGDSRTFVVIGFDSTRRGIELALPDTLAAATALVSSSPAIGEDAPPAASKPAVATKAAPQRKGSKAASLAAADLSSDTESPSKSNRTTGKTVAKASKRHVPKRAASEPVSESAAPVVKAARPVKAVKPVKPVKPVKAVKPAEAAVAKAVLPRSSKPADGSATSATGKSRKGNPPGPSKRVAATAPVKVAATAPVKVAAKATSKVAARASARDAAKTTKASPARTPARDAAKTTNTSPAKTPSPDAAKKASAKAPVEKASAKVKASTNPSLKTSASVAAPTTTTPKAVKAPNAASVAKASKRTSATPVKRGAASKATSPRNG